MTLQNHFNHTLPAQFNFLAISGTHAQSQKKTKVVPKISDTGGKKSENPAMVKRDGTIIFTRRTDSVPAITTTIFFIKSLGGFHPPL